MKRPQSAKMGMRGYWGQSNTDQISQHNTSNKNLSRKQVVIMKPDLTSHDFSRILPKKIHQDKERLYSETLQLKQSLNEIMEENIRLKTKISILQKQKSRMGKHIESGIDVSTKKSNSRLNIYASKVSEKQNNIIQSLKKMVRESKEQVQYLKTQNLKIKKTIKYTKINQMEIEKKILFDQNKRINQMLEEITQHVNDQSQLERQNGQLKKYLQDEMQENKLLSQENQKYEIVLEELQNKIKSQAEKYQNKQKKLTKDLAIQRRKVQQSQRCIEDLRKQVSQLRLAQSEGEKAKPKPITRPTSSIPNKRYNHSQASMKKQATNQTIEKRQETLQNDVDLKSETEQIKTKNNQLEQELRQIRSKLQKSENELKLRTQIQNPKQQKQKVVQSQPEKPFKKKEQEVAQPIASKQQSLKLIAQEKKVPTIRKVTQKQTPKKAQEQSYNEGFEKQDDQENYNEQFEKIEESKESKESRLQEQMKKVKQEFEQNEQEQQIYKKQESNKNDKSKNAHKKKKKQQNSASASKKGYKPDKKLLSQIKELLTYRMKAQRYPYEDLKADFLSAETSQFTYIQLYDMFINEPFYLTTGYAKSLLSYCYESEVISEEDLLNGDIIVAKLRKVIEDFQLIDEEQQKEMIIRISQMTCTYPQQLQAAFEDIKNGEETVSKAKLVEMFEKLELEKKYIQLIIAELTLCSDNLEHLNFHGFFERFYIQENDPNHNQNHPIEEQGQQSEQSYRDVSKKKKSTKNIKKNTQDQDEDYNMGRYMMAIDSRIPEKPSKFDDEDIVSDDGRI